MRVAVVVSALFALSVWCTANAQQSPSQKANPGETIAIQGVVVGPDQRPVGGAKLYFNTGERRDSIELGTSNVDGSFRFHVPLEMPAKTVAPAFSLSGRQASVLAVADGFGAAWDVLSSNAGRRFGETQSEYEFTLRLVEDVPVKGRLVDPTGKPVAGATITVDRIHELRGDKWHKMSPAIESLDVDSINRTEIDVINWSSSLSPRAWAVVDSAVSDDSGEFTLSGLGSNRAAVLHVAGPGVQRPLYLSVVVREDAAEFARLVREKYPSNGRNHGVRMFGIQPQIVVQRARTVAGIVRDESTGKPVAGAFVYVLGVSGRAKTDRDGRYRLVRSEKRSQITMVAYGDDERYLSATRTLTDVDGLGEASADFQLPRGVVVRGKVIESDTDRPIFSDHRLGCHDVAPGPLVAGYASYYPLKNNQWMKEMGDGLASIPFESSRSNHLRKVTIDGEGEFRVAVPPGSGIILIESRPPLNDQQFRMVPEVPYLTLRGNVTGAERKAPPTGLSFRGFARPIVPDDFHAYKLINPAEHEREIDLRFELKLPQANAVRFTDPNGKPVAGVMVAGLLPDSKLGVSRVLETESPDAVVYDLRADEPRRIIAVSADGRYAAAHSTTNTGETTFRFRLQPAASLRFRLVDDEKGDPLVGYQLYHFYQNGTDPRIYLYPKSQQIPVTDQRGEVVISAIVPGQTMSMFFVPPTKKSADSSYGLGLGREIKTPEQLTKVMLNAGESRDLGDVRAEPIIER